MFVFVILVCALNRTSKRTGRIAEAFNDENVLSLNSVTPTVDVTQRQHGVKRNALPCVSNLHVLLTQSEVKQMLRKELKKICIRLRKTWME